MNKPTTKNLCKNSTHHFNHVVIAEKKYEVFGDNSSTLKSSKEKGVIYCVSCGMKKVI